MRKLLLLVIVGAAVFWMFKHPDTLRRYSEPVFAQISQFFGQLAGNRQRQPDPIPVEDLPNGVYCLTQPAHFSFSGGGSTLQPAGALVRKTGEGNPGKVLVTDEVGSAVVDASLLTRDPALAVRLAEESRANMPPPTHDAKGADKQLDEIDAKLASLRSELISIQQRDLAAIRIRHRVRFATTETFVRNSIATLERHRADLLASRKQVAP